MGRGWEGLREVPGTALGLHSRSASQQQQSESKLLGLACFAAASERADWEPCPASQQSDGCGVVCACGATFCLNQAG